MNLNQKISDLSNKETDKPATVKPIVLVTTFSFIGALFLFVFSSSYGTASEMELLSGVLTSATGNSMKNRPEHVMGVSAADCKKCHPSEVASWMKTVHYQSAELRLYKDIENTEKYRKALKLDPDALLNNSVCADCHGIKATRDGVTKVIAGVSCESCHSAAGGDQGWLNRHQSYHESKNMTRSEESSKHRKDRQDFCDEAGMIRSDNIYGMAKKCFNCHLIGNEKLIAAGHKSASAFDYVSWSTGEVRHNFLVDKNVNLDAPSLWVERTSGTAENRKRLKFVIGTLVQLETALRLRANTKNLQFIPQIGGVVAASNGKLSQINAMAGTPEVQSVTMLILPLLGRMFVPQGDDKKVYTDIADEVSKQARLFEKNHDGSQFKALDALINSLPAHYSLQYKEKYGTP
jgi:Cytochrome c554 and c-prime